MILEKACRYLNSVRVVTYYTKCLVETQLLGPGLVALPEPLCLFSIYRARVVYERRRI